MEVTQPHYYGQFRCLASACPDSCCHEWAVGVDDETAAHYLVIPGELGDRLRQKLKHSEDGWYLEITDGRCPMWRGDGLCEIQCQLGHEALCQTCRDFPRLRHDYGNFAELGLELSCPEAARLILTSPDLPPVTGEAPGGSDPDYDQDTMAVLLRSRETALTILARHPLPQALSYLLIYSHYAQAAVDGSELSDFDTSAADALLVQLSAAGDAKALVDFYAGLEILTPRWQTLLNTPSPRQDWPEALRAMARYGIRRYWLQAVSDWELTARVKMIVAGCILVHHLGGDVLQTAQLYSKEIESDPDNVDAILDAAYTSPALTDLNLVSLLQS